MLHSAGRKADDSATPIARSRFQPPITTEAWLIGTAAAKRRAPTSDSVRSLA